MEGFVKTYVERKGLLGQALEVCEARVEWISLQVQCMSAKVRRMIDLGSIYIKKIVTSGKTPARVLVKFSAIGSTLRCRTWGTGSRKNLMKMRLECWNIKSVSWVDKKASSQSEVIYDEHKVSIVTSKSSFLPKEPKKRISRGYCRGDRPRSTNLCIYWVGGPIRGH